MFSFSFSHSLVHLFNDCNHQGEDRNGAPVFTSALSNFSRNLAKSVEPQPLPSVFDHVPYLIIHHPLANTLSHSPVFGKNPVKVSFFPLIFLCFLTVIFYATIPP